MKPLIRVLAGVFTVLVGVAGARAHEADLPLVAAPFEPRWEVSLAAQIGINIAGERCVGNGSDVVGCTGLGLIAFEFAPRYRFRHVSVGGFAQLGKGSDANLLRFGAEARYLPLDTVDVEPWIGADLGAALLIDSLPMNADGPADTFVTAAPALGVSAGLEFAAGETVSFGVSARLFWLAIGRDSVLDVAREPHYEHPLMLTGGIVGTFRFD